MNFSKFRPELKLAVFSLLSTLVFWLTFSLNLPTRLGFPPSSMETLFANYDGPYYLVIAKCGYVPSCIATQFALPTPLEYYPAHLPGYPLIIRTLDIFFTGPWAMLVATLLGTMLLSIIFYHFLRHYLSPKVSFWLSILLMFFPPRLLVLRLIGSPETWYLASIVGSILFFLKQKYLPSALLAVLAQSLKSPGILLPAAFFLSLLFQKKLSARRFWPYLLVPLSVLLIFSLFGRDTGDFLAYFNSGDNIHLVAFPYAVFLSFRSWLGTIWLEDIIYLFFLIFIGLFLLRRYWPQPTFIFPLIYTLASIFVAHRDLSRYLAPVYPFMILAFAPYLRQKPVYYSLLLILPAVILYAINFIIGNTAPIVNWTPYL
ncbi:MAG: hypothetical protein WCT01_02715 [Candidatus Shapirobacteria bacterium]